MEEIKKLDLGSHRESGFRNTGKLPSPDRKTLTIVHGEQELIRFINEGRNLVKELSDEKYVVKRIFD